MRGRLGAARGRLVTALAAEAMKRQLSEWHIPGDWLFILGWPFVSFPVVILFGMFFLALSAAGQPFHLTLRLIAGIRVLLRMILDKS